jgi:hypothetical protein
MNSSPLLSMEDVHLLFRGMTVLDNIKFCGHNHMASHTWQALVETFGQSAA